MRTKRERPKQIAIGVLALALTTSFAACTSTPSAALTVTGTVDDTTVTMSVPTLGDAEYVGVSKMEARVGDTVAEGQEIAVLDTSTLDAQLAQAKADQAAAKAEVPVLQAAIDATYDKAAEISEAKAKAKKAVKEAKSTRAKLVKTQKQLKKTRPGLAEKLSQAQTLLANYPPVAVPGVPTKAELKAAIKQLKAAIKKVDAGLKQIAEAIPKIDKGLKTAKTAITKLDDAAAKIVDARASLQAAKKLAQSAADASSVPVELAKAQIQLGTITAPATGIVVQAANSGEQLAPGAPLVVIRPDQPSTITAWLSPAQAGEVCSGEGAAVVGDWMGSGISEPATLAYIGTDYEYPPTAVTTDEIHLTRALKVSFSTEASLPAGVPVDVTLDGCENHG
ncbi:MAG: HlyD family secretion protein [Propionibacteriaceae bacterium]|nr:HlyD family secretion protein [Propionibacteriaceae bacterium]